MALAIIGAFWIVVLVPPIVRARAEHVSRDSIRDFSFKIRALGGANAPYRPAAFRSPGRPAAPIVRPAVGAAPTVSSYAAERSAIRRRQVFSVLGLFAVVTLMLAVSGLPMGWALFGLSLVLLAGYAGLVAWLRPASRSRIPVERLAPVRYLPPSAPRRTAATPEYVYRRTS